MVRKRRGKGEGSIYRRKEGRWVGQYEVNGKRRYVSGKTRAEVSKQLTNAKAERDAGLVFDAEGLTVDEYLTCWLDTIRGTVKDNTWTGHEINVRVHLSPALGSTKLDKLNPFQVQSFYRAKLDDGQSPASVLKVHSTLSKALKAAVRWRLIPLRACYEAG
jgi:integrase